MPLGVYKPGQGKWARGVAAIGLAALGLWAAIETYDWMRYAGTTQATNVAELIVTKDEALKIIDWAERDGFFARAVVDTGRADNATCIVKMLGAQTRLREAAVPGPEFLKRLDALQGLVGPAVAADVKRFRATVQGESEKAKTPVKAGAPTPAAEAARWKQQMTYGVDDFALWLYCGSQERQESSFLLTLSTRGPSAWRIAWEAFASNLRYIIPALLLLGFTYAAWRVANRAPTTDFIIETEIEMKKVTWPTARDVAGSTVVVIIVTVMLGLFMYIVDLVLVQWAFKPLGIF
jgi:preprotein translocase subunit SecE